MSAEGSECLAGGGAAGALMRSIDWARTPVGPVASWSPALRSTVALLLHNHAPLLLWWGREFVQLYNDAYRPVLGVKHPHSMGQPGYECWAEIWHIIGPMAESPLRGGPASTSDDLCVFINRKGFAEETHFRVAYSPVPDPTVAGTGIGGVLATVTETTEQVYGERQLRTLRELGARAAGAKTAEQACDDAAATLAENRRDVPFALFYLLDDDGRRARLAASVGVAAGSANAPAEMDLSERAVPRCPWRLKQAIEERRVRAIDDLAAIQASLPLSAHGEHPRTAVEIPLASPEQANAYGVLVCGLSPHRLLDDGYRAFLELAAAQVVTAIRNARAFETERRRAEQLAALDRAKTMFFTNISHEFRTPLTLMLGPTEDALRTGAALAGAELAAVHRNELRLLKLVNSLLDFARIEAGRAQACFEPTDLAALTRDLASAFRAAVERAGLAFHIACPRLDQPIYVDHALWEKLVLNLLSNALKFTFEGSISVELRDTAEGVELRVQDSGTGISPAELPRMFERFHRIEGARGRTHEGSGIGLALVAEIAQMHGGSVAVESAVDRGSTFIVRLRRGTAHLPPERIGSTSSLVSTATGAEAFVEEATRWLPGAEASAPDELYPAPPATSRDETRGARVLLADDNADMREYLGRLLSHIWRVEAVGNGAAALEAARRERPDLILSDIMMPVLDGFGLLREIRADPRLHSVPIILLSARAGEESRVEGLQAGADDYLVKPFAARELVARVTTHLQFARVRAAAEDAADTLRAIFDNAPVGLALFDRELHYLQVNRTLAEFNRRSVEAHLGRRITDVLPELPAADLETKVRAVLADGQLHPGQEVRDPTPDHPTGRILEGSYFPVKRADGEIIGVGKILIDVTEGRRAEAERARAARFTELFVGILGHDLRNPLNAITIGAVLLQQKLASSPDALIVDRIITSANRMARMVGQLLDLTRARVAGGIAIMRQPANLSAVVVAAVDELRTVYPNREVHTSVPESLDGGWDADRLAQVVSNLVGNALEHGEPERPIRLRLLEQDGTATLTVHNHGAPIPPDMIPVLFDPFRAGDRGAGKATSGLGLGLYISAEIVRAHDGAISVHSDADATTFTVTLPIRPSAATPS